MRATRQLSSVRSGFTLVEILVVIAIISVLAGLVAAGVFAVIATQRRTNTQNNLRAVYKALARHMKFVVDKADKETIPVNVQIMAGGDMKRARVIWKKLRLKQEFPMTFAEAQAPYNSWEVPTTNLLDPTDLPPLKPYLTALQGLGGANGTVVNGVAQPYLESSTLILLSLQQNRGGVGLTPDQLGSYALDVNNDGLKEVIDGWGTPVAFFRFPTGNNDLNSKNPASAGTAAATYADPYDPEGTLVNPAWNNSLASVGSFEQLCHLVHDPSNAVYTPWPRYILPTLVSAGPDGRWGLGTMAGVNPDMSIDSTAVTKGVLDSTDNIYSYLLNLDN